MSDEGDGATGAEEGDADQQSRSKRALQYVLDLIDLVVDLV